MRAAAAIVLILFARAAVAAPSQDQQFLKLAEEYNQNLPRKFGSLVVEKVSYQPDTRAFITTHKLLDQDLAQMNPDLIPTYQRLSQQSLARQLCLARITSKKSRAYLLKEANLTLQYHYVDRHDKPLFSFSVAKEDCARP